MTSPPRRRPLPALIALIALTLLTALVWWRVLNRGDSQAAADATCGSSHPSSASLAHVVPRPEDVHVAVLNATDRSGLAHKTARALQGTERGFKVAAVGNDTQHKSITGGVALIRYPPGAEPDARLLSSYIPGAKREAIAGGGHSSASGGATGSGTTKAVALKLSLGKNFDPAKLATTAQARKQLNKSGYALASSSPSPAATATPAPESSCAR